MIIMKNQWDYIILGAGIYGLYASKILIEKGFKVALLEYDSTSFTRASYINQARVHRGYHYPRSFSTAIKSAGYFSRFTNDFDFAINSKFKKVYGIAQKYSLTSREQFIKFCENAEIPCEEIDAKKYFIKDMVEGAFETEEFAFDALMIRDWFMEKLKDNNNFSIFYNIRIKDVTQKGDKFEINIEDGSSFSAFSVVNTTYASINQMIDRFGFDKFQIKYEISEIILCDVNDSLKESGVTLMDGPFFSVMPFGLQGHHSMTSVTFTHHKTCYDKLPIFQCQNNNKKCTSIQLENCNDCIGKPKSSWNSMVQLSRKYLNPNIEIKYIDSLFSIKPILTLAQLDDSRPTIVKEHCKNPRFISILSGKINTIYDLDEVLK